MRVAEMGSFTRASISLNLSQPTLSRQIKLLEAELQQHLLIRNGRGVAANQAGKILLEHARGVLHQISLVKEELDRARGLASGRVAVGIPPSPARILTIPITHEFLRRFPDATLTIKESLTANLISLLMTGQLDVGLLYNSPPLQNIRLHPIREDRLFLVRRKSSRRMEPTVDLGALAQIPLLLPSKPHSLRMLLERETTALGFHPRVVLEIDSVPSILDLILDGSGAAVLPLHAVQTSEKSDLLQAQKIVNPCLISRIAVATCSTRPMTVAQKEMATMLGDIARQRLAPK